MKQWKRVSGVVLSGILALSMTLGGMTAPDAGAKAKKAKLKTKKISVTVGKKKTIKIVKKKKLAKLKGIDCFVQLMKEKINKI